MFNNRLNIYFSKNIKNVLCALIKKRKIDKFLIKKNKNIFKYFYFY